MKYKLKAGIINAYNRGDLEEAKRRQNQLERKLRSSTSNPTKRKLVSATSKNVEHEWMHALEGSTQTRMTSTLVLDHSTR